MDIKEKIKNVRHRAAQVTMKIATVAVMGSAGMASSCTGTSNETAGENAEKIENVIGSEKNENVANDKTSVVFRTRYDMSGNLSDHHILLENGDVICPYREGTFLEVGDTLTYEGNDIKAIRYKGGEGKEVNFGEIGKIAKGNTR